MSLAHQIISMVLESCKAKSRPGWKYLLHLVLCNSISCPFCLVPTLDTLLAMMEKHTLIRDLSWLFSSLLEHILVLEWPYSRLYCAGRQMVHLKVEILVERELWRSPSPASLSKEDCCHLWHCPSRKPLSISRAAGRRKGCC